VSSPAPTAGCGAESDPPPPLLQSHRQHFLTLFEYPLVDGVGTPEGQLPLAELPTLDISLTDTADTLEPALRLIAEAGLT
jgi:hypothetical protein